MMEIRIIDGQEQGVIFSWTLTAEGGYYAYSAS